MSASDRTLFSLLKQKEAVSFSFSGEKRNGFLLLCHLLFFQGGLLTTLPLDMTAYNPANSITLSTAAGKPSMFLPPAVAK